MTKSILIIDTPENCNLCPAGNFPHAKCPQVNYDSPTRPSGCQIRDGQPEVSDFLQKLQDDLQIIEGIRLRAKTAEDRERVVWGLVDWLCQHRGLNCPPTINAGDVDCTTIECDQCWALEAAKAVAAAIEKRRQK
jgi:hypothetical protein